jgi:hypothetical protein
MHPSLAIVGADKVLKTRIVAGFFQPTFRTLSVTLKYLTLKALTGKGYAILVQMNYLRLIENNLILLR